MPGFSYKARPSKGKIDNENHLVGKVYGSGLEPKSKENKPRLSPFESTALLDFVVDKTITHHKMPMV